MTSIHASHPVQSLHATQGRLPLGSRPVGPAPSPEQVAKAEQTQEAFSKFVGATLFGQMLSSMRKTVGEPAYFHGGQAEKVFQGQLDNQIADEMTASGASPFAKAMFEQQFPDLADVLRRDAAHAEGQQPPALPRAGDNRAPDMKPLDQLATLRRR